MAYYRAVEINGPTQGNVNESLICQVKKALQYYFYKAQLMQNTTIYYLRIYAYIVQVYRNVRI